MTRGVDASDSATDEDAGNFLLLREAGVQFAHIVVFNACASVNDDDDICFGEIDGVQNQPNISALAPRRNRLFVPL